MLAGSFLAVGMGAAQAQVCHPDNPYDSISTSFHQSVAQRTDGGWAGWGQGLDKGSNALSPTDITSDDFAGMGEPLRMTTASSTTNHQTIALTANGLYVWGSNDIVFANSNTYLENAVSGVRKVKDFPSANISGLPTGTLPGGGFYDIQPDDVTMMTASYGALAIVAKVGSEQYAWLFTSRSNADGWLGVGRNKWELVQTKEDESDPVPLSDVKAMRVQNGDTASSGAVMVHAGDKVYTFGNSVYLGGGDNKITPAYAQGLRTRIS